MDVQQIKKILEKNFDEFIKNNNLSIELVQENVITDTMTEDDMFNIFSAYMCNINEMIFKLQDLKKKFSVLKNTSFEEIKKICEELDLIHGVDPFTSKTYSGDFRYFRLHGIDNNKYRYKGWDLKLLRDFCENETKHLNDKRIYVLFGNSFMMSDARRFEWIAKHTGRIKEIDLSFLKVICHEIEAEEEDEKVQKLSREAERIVTLILHTDYALVDIEIEKEIT